MDRHENYTAPKRHAAAGLIAGAIAFLTGSAVANAQQDACRARIEVTLDAEVNDPRDPSFLTSLLATPGYQLTWVSGNDETAIYDLQGPASDIGCEDMVEQIGKSAAVLKVRVVIP